jgi:hypothetical protein
MVEYVVDVEEGTVGLKGDNIDGGGHVRKMISALPSKSGRATSETKKSRSPPDLAN